VLDPFAAARDAAMPFLAGATDPAEVEPRLSAVLDSPGASLLAVRVVRHKPGRRCLVEYDVEWQRAGRPREPMTILGKSRARGSAESSDRLLRDLWARGFAADSEDGISVAEPLGVLGEYHMSLQRKVPGVPATLALEAQGPPLARRIAEAICKLHHTGIAPARSHTIDDELAILRERLERLAAESPEWRPRLERILRECGRLARGLTTRSARGIHRDFYPAQVIVDGARLCLIDFDLYCEGDPALDAGNFVGHLVEEALRHCGQADARRDCEVAFEERFHELSPDVPRRSVRAYATLTLARHIELSTRFPERRPFTESLIELCEERLAAGHRAGETPRAHAS
jgi:hypothetical protein